MILIRRVLIRVLAAGLWLAVAGCSGVPSGEGGFSIPLGGADSSAGSDGDYRLQSGDEVDVAVYREPQLSGVFRVDSSGTIRHPLAGAFRVGGLTVEEAERELTSLLGEKYLKNPRVMMSIVSAQSAHVVILGEVENPGVQPIPFSGNMTLLQVVAEAGGFTELASVDRVTVTRAIDGKEQSMRVRVSRIIAGKEPDVELEPNDVIMIPEIIF